MLTATADETGAATAAERQLVKPITVQGKSNSEAAICRTFHFTVQYWGGGAEKRKDGNAHRQNKQSESFLCTYIQGCQVAAGEGEQRRRRVWIYTHHYCSVINFSAAHTSHANVLLIIHTHAHWLPHSGRPFIARKTD